MWKVATILLIIFITLILFAAAIKISYSVGYEDGKSGIMTLIQNSYETQKQITQIPINENNKYFKEIVYIFVDKL